VDYIKSVTEMKSTKSCLCRRTVTVMMERQQQTKQFLIASSNHLNITMIT